MSEPRLNHFLPEVEEALTKARDALKAAAWCCDTCHRSVSDALRPYLAGGQPPSDEMPEWVQQIEAVRQWQDNGKFHPLTCGNGTGGHPPLVPALLGERVVLVCLQCDYLQEWIPEVVLGRAAERGVSAVPPNQEE